MSDRFAVIGAGQMGNGIAHVCATSGFPVTLIDVSADALATNNYRIIIRPIANQHRPGRVGRHK